MTDPAKSTKQQKFEVCQKNDSFFTIKNKVFYFIILFTLSCVLHDNEVYRLTMGGNNETKVQPID